MSTDLAPVRAALIADAERRAAQVRAEAARVAQDLADRARTEAEALLEQAAREGAAAGGVAAALSNARARREAHGVVLTASQRLRDATVAATVAQARALRDDPCYPALLDAWTATCRAALGHEVQVREAPDGGVVGVQGSRRLDLRLGTLAARAAEDVLAEEGDPWS